MPILIIIKIIIINNNDNTDFISRGHSFDNTSIFHEGLS